MRFALIIGAIAALETTALAAPTAENLYNEGQAAYDHADYPTAIARWQTAYQLSGESGLLFNLAQARRLSGDCAGALSTYKRFVAIDPTADQHQLALDLARELEPSCGARPVEQPLPAQVNARPGQTLRIAGLVAGGAGVVSIGVGLLLGHHAQALGAEVTTACAVSCDWTVQKSKDAAGRRDASIGYALDVVGVAAIAGGAVMYYLGDRESPVTVAPRGREGGAVISWSGSW